MVELSWSRPLNTVSKLKRPAIGNYLLAEFLGVLRRIRPLQFGSQAAIKEANLCHRERFVVRNPLGVVTHDLEHHGRVHVEESVRIYELSRFGI